MIVHASRLCTLAALAALTLSAATGCQTDALTGKKTLNLYSYEEEKRLGDEAVQPILAELGGLYPDTALQQYLDEVGQKVAAAGRTRLKGQAEFPDWPFQFYLVNSSMLNAFALPGGHVFVTRGILLRLKDEAELAGLLGHEVAHVFGRHGVERISKVQLMILPVALLGAFEETQGVAVVGVIAVQLLAMKYGRDDETESDKFGMRFAARAGYHPAGIIGVMQMLKDFTHEHGGGGPEFLSTHPDPGNRVKYLGDQLRKEYPDADAGAYVRNPDRFDNALIQVRAAQPAYDLADQGDAAMALGFKAAEKGDSAGARAEYTRALGLYNQAVAKVRDHAILHVNVAQARFYLEQYDGAEQAIVQALRYDGMAFWPNFMGGLVAIKRNDNATAERRLEQALKLVPDSPVGMFYLAVAYDRGQKTQPAVSHYRKAYDAFGGEGTLAESARRRLIELGEPDPRNK
ncbi:MAG: M48 family metalloprotease [Planctomycetes bacterium]|jgi:predicted Zn-dependent protease|nr:M48 family metalloprotease [Planctomycetota bacterium]MCL4729077.1 M48 family metalloprotease [Planctomycetota bacterium]